MKYSILEVSSVSFRIIQWHEPLKDKNSPGWWKEVASITGDWQDACALLRDLETETK